MKKGKDNKPHIGIYGRRNVGKSSFINALTGTDTAIISAIAGTTTDPVKKSIEIFSLFKHLSSHKIEHCHKPNPADQKLNGDHRNC